MGVRWHELIPVLAHDARALVRKGITNAQLLERSSAPAQDSPQFSQLRAIIESQQSLNRLFARVVELADAENTEKRSSFLESTDLHTAILAAKLDCRQALLNSQAEFIVGEVPACRVPKRTQTVLRELIDNSIRFGDSSRGLRITIEAEATDDAVRVRVSDTGSGIESAYAHKLFQPLQRLDAARSGFGLGLAIAKAIVDSVSGNIFHEPRELGAVFVFELPANPA